MKGAPRAKVRPRAFEPPPGVGAIEPWLLAALLPTALFTVLLFAAPMLLPPGSTGDLSGRVGTVDNRAVWEAFSEPVRSVYFAGDVECHTKASRSFELNGNQMPVCARDIAIFLGMTGGLALALSPRSRLYQFAVTMPWWGYFALLAPIGVDGGAQDFLGFESDNLRRLLTGFPAGLAVALALAFIAYEGRFALDRRRRARGRAKAPAGEGHAEVGAPASTSTGSLGSKLVESAPTEKKHMLHP